MKIFVATALLFAAACASHPASVRIDDSNAVCKNEATIEVRAVDATGNAVPGALVTLRLTDRTGVRSATTRTSGETQPVCYALGTEQPYAKQAPYLDDTDRSQRGTPISYPRAQATCDVQVAAPGHDPVRVTATLQRGRRTLVTVALDDRS